MTSPAPDLKALAEETATQVVNAIAHDVDGTEEDIILAALQKAYDLGWLDCGKAVAEELEL